MSYVIIWIVFFEINKDYNIVSNQRSEIYRDEILIDLLKRYSTN